MDNGQILGALGIAMSVIGTIVMAINRKKCRSKCCGKEATASVSIEDATPPNSVPKLSAPPELNC